MKDYSMKCKVSKTVQYGMIICKIIHLRITVELRIINITLFCTSMARPRHAHERFASNTAHIL